MKIKKVVDLIKRCYDQPILFHRLHSHLTCILRTINPLHEMSDEWSKILVYSAIRSKHPNQALESKVLGLLKSIRPGLSDRGSRLKLWIILYYMKNRSPDQVNHLILFELVSNFIGISSYTDGLIISIFSSGILGPTFGLPGNKKMRDDSVVHLLEMMRVAPLGLLNRAKCLPCYVNHEVESQGLLDFNVENDVMSVEILSNVCFYAKYTKSIEFVKRIVPGDPRFIESLKKFISKSFRIESESTEEMRCEVMECVVENFDVLNEIKKAYDVSSDKKGFVSRIMDFVMELK